VHFTGLPGQFAASETGYRGSGAAWIADWVIQQTAEAIDVVDVTPPAMTVPVPAVPLG
jgi:hypothetical protein